MADEQRASDVIERLEMMGFGGGLTEEDLTGSAVREPLRETCTQIAQALRAIHTIVPAADDAALAAGVRDMCAAARSQAAAADGALDAALSRLAFAVDDQLQAPCRVVRLEALVSCLQATRVLAARAQSAAAAAAARDEPAVMEGVAVPAAAAAGVAVGDAGGDAGSMDVDGGSDAAASAELCALARLLGVAWDRSQALPVLVDVEAKLKALVEQLPPGFFQPLLPPDWLDTSQQGMLAEVHGSLQQEYTLRRRMLVERAKVTLQSFLWAPRLAESGAWEAAHALVSREMAAMVEAPQVQLREAFAVTPADVAAASRRATAGEGGAFAAAIKRVLIGKVPDRGGRTAGRATDMPEWAPRREGEGSNTGARGGGGGGGGRGDRRPKHGGGSSGGGGAGAKQGVGSASGGGRGAKHTKRGRKGG